MKVVLEVLNGPQQGRIMEFHEPRGFVIGRARGADFRLPSDDAYVSRRHVFLEICPPSCRLRDLGSTNPPHVNDSPFEERNLNHGDILELGYTRFKVLLDSEHQWTKEERPASEPQRAGLITGLFGWIGARPNPPPRISPSSSASTALPRCSVCDVDLAGKANSDGRGEELRSVAIYCCEDHVPDGDRFQGTSIGRYEVLRRLGEGGMGVVFLVYHRDTCRVLALKQITDVANRSLAKRFEREIRLLKNIDHQNVVRCVDTGIVAGDTPFIVTEYVPDGSLSDYAASKDGTLRIGEAIKLIGDALKGLEFIHSHSIIHRDIKPDNILLRFSSPERDAITKLADFGLAVSYARGGGTRLTKRNIGMGTLMYTPPEQWLNARDVKPAADTYAMGVSLYYLLTGRYSFDFPSPQEIRDLRDQKPDRFESPEAALQALMRLHRINHPIEIILSEDPIPIHERDRTLPKSLACVVDRAVRKDPAERYQTAAEFGRDLDRAMR